MIYIIFKIKQIQMSAIYKKLHQAENSPFNQYVSTRWAPVPHFGNH